MPKTSPRSEEEILWEDIIAESNQKKKAKTTKTKQEAQPGARACEHEDQTMYGDILGEKEKTPFDNPEQYQPPAPNPGEPKPIWKLLRGDKLADIRQWYPRLKYEFLTMVDIRRINQNKANIYRPYVHKLMEYQNWVDTLPAKYPDVKLETIHAIVYNDEDESYAGSQRDMFLHCPIKDRIAALETFLIEANWTPEKRKEQDSLGQRGIWEQTELYSTPKQRAKYKVNDDFILNSEKLEAIKSRQRDAAIAGGWKAEEWDRHKEEQAKKAWEAIKEYERKRVAKREKNER